MDLDPEEAEVREYLKRNHVSVYELRRVILKFEGYRTTTTGAAKGAAQKIDVEVLDMGPDRPDLRYAVTVVSEDGKEALSNGAPTIAIALASTPWTKLDA